MPVGPPVEGPKGKRLHEPPEAEDATLEVNDPGVDNLSPN